nr:MAG: RNA-dependent RNA polymerase [Porcine picobirnavirus]
MKIKSFSQELQTRIDRSEGYQRALATLLNGKEATRRSWVYEKVDPAEVLSSWMERLTQLESDEDLKLIAEWDLGKASKFGPQGEVAPFSERQETLKEYWEHLSCPTIFSTPLWEKAIKATILDLGFNQSGSPVSYDRVVDRGLGENKYTTSSCDPLFQRRKLPSSIAQAVQAATDGTWKKYYPVLGSRATMGKVGKEARWIFMFPFSVNLVEQSFQQPLQDYIRSKRVEFFTPWEGWESVQKVISSKSSHLLKFGCDYTKMDQHFNYWHAEQCYHVIKHFFHPKYWDRLHESIEYTFNCDIVAAEYLIEGPHAMPSGSGWTNFLETMFNFILLHYLEMKFHLKFEGAMGIGDDQLYFIDYEGDVDGLTELIVRTFNECGLDSQSQKQEVHYTHTTFLQRSIWATWNGVDDSTPWAGVYPTVRALTSEIYPEMYHNDDDWDAETFALRCLMIMENCNQHPLFKEFCIFIAEGNSNIKDYVLSGPENWKKVVQRARGIRNFIPTYNQAVSNMDCGTMASIRVLEAYYRNRA